jgi:hypothetical protein
MIKMSPAGLPILGGSDYAPCTVYHGGAITLLRVSQLVGGRAGIPVQTSSELLPHPLLSSASCCLLEATVGKPSKGGGVEKGVTQRAVSTPLAEE